MSYFQKGVFQTIDNVNQHFENFALIGSIAENIGISEVSLRNRIDFVLCEQDSQWLDKLPIDDIKVEKPKEPNPSRDKIISTQRLGFWVMVAEKYKIEGKLFSKEFLDNLDFKRYYAKNANRFKNKANLQNYQKANLLLHLLRNLRNRALHFENMYKLNKNGKPKLIASILNDTKSICVINLETTKIQTFLNDLIDELVKLSHKAG